jgi:putative aldouronate transport system substrate-binding protein
MKKRILAVAMTAAMAATMIPATAFADDDLPTISFMVPEYDGKALKNEGSDQVIEAYESYTGMHVDIKWADNGAYSEIFGTTLLDFDNMPMILTATGSLSGTVVDAAKQGAFWDLTEYLQDSEMFPNLSQASSVTLKGLTVDGEIIGIPRLRELGRNGISYRKDWAEAVGITEDPQTIDDVYDMLWKFTYEDPDGNGKDDTYGLEMTKYTGPFDVMQTWFGCGNGWVEQDGDLVPVHMTAEYKEAIDWFKKLYDDGLMRPDWATIDTSEWSNGCKKGENGVFVDVMDSGRRIWDYFVTNEVPSVTNPDEYASMVLLGTINDKTLATSGYNGYYLITTDGAKTEEDVINCLTFLDKLNDYDMLILADYGIEGLSYEWNEDGYLEKYDLDSYPQNGLNQMVAYIPGYSADENPLQQTERDLALTECYETKTRPNAVSNPALAYLSSSETYAKYGSDLATMLDDARTQYICGTIDEQGLQDAWDDWYEKGGADLIAEINELYHADQGTQEEETETVEAESTEEAAE